MPFSIPVIETERLRLRPHRLEDFPDCVSMWSDPVVTRYTTGAPSPEQRTWMRLLTYLGHWSLLGYGYWAVEEKSSAKFIGELGFADFKRVTEPSTAGIPELGWALASDAHGKGYATEALRAVTAWGDRHFESARTICMIQPENLASIRVAEKIGFRQWIQGTHNGAPILLFERKRDSREP